MTLNLKKFTLARSAESTIDWIAIISRSTRLAVRAFREMLAGLIALMTPFRAGAVPVALARRAIGKIPLGSGTLQARLNAEHARDGATKTARHASSRAAIRSVITPTTSRILLKKKIISLLNICVIKKKPGQRDVLGIRSSCGTTCTLSS